MAVKTFSNLSKAGSDPRTIRSLTMRSMFQRAEDELGTRQAKLGDKYVYRSLTGAILGGFNSQLGKEQLASEKRGEDAGIRQQAIAKQVQTEIEAQPSLQGIKQKRKSLVELEAKAMARKTGRRALLTSAPGGGGFFGGYFNGR